MNKVNKKWYADSDAAYKVWVDADRAWQNALVSKFGKNAGDVRYTAEGRSGEVLAPLYAEFERTRDAYHAIVFSKPVPQPAIAVIFRKWRKENEEVFAIFPLEPCDLSGYLCSSYSISCGHGGCDPYAIIPHTRPATEDEYKPLLTHLENNLEGYENLRILRRIPANALNIRKSEIFDCSKL